MTDAARPLHTSMYPDAGADSVISRDYSHDSPKSRPSHALHNVMLSVRNYRGRVTMIYTFSGVRVCACRDIQNGNCVNY